MPSRHVISGLLAAATTTGLLAWHSALSAEVAGREIALRSITRRAINGTTSINLGNSYYKGEFSWNITNINPTDKTGTFTGEIYIEKTAESSDAISGTMSTSITYNDTTVHSGLSSYDFPENCPVGTRAYLGSGAMTVTLNLCADTNAEICASIDGNDSNFKPTGSIINTNIASIPVYTNVTYNATGGSVSPTSFTMTCGYYGTLAEATREGYTFDGWYTAPGEDGSKIFTTSRGNYTKGPYSIYAHWTINNYTEKFVINGVTVKEETLAYNTAINYPAENPKKTGYSFAYWCENENTGVEYIGTTVPAHNLTLYAKFTVNKYTVKFVSDGATVKEEMLAYNTAINFPAENPKKTGYAFNGWNPKPERVGAENITISAEWVEITTEYVEIVFGRADMNEEEIKEIISKYTTEDSYRIEKFEGEGDKTIVIIKFNDASTVEEFSRKATPSESDSVEYIGYNTKATNSGAGVFQPLSLFGIIVA